MLTITDLRQRYAYMKDVEYLERVADPVTSRHLAERIEDLEALRSKIERCDRTLANYAWPAIVCTPAERADLEGHMRIEGTYSQAYALGNLSGRIRRLRAKLAALREQDTTTKGAPCAN